MPRMPTGAAVATRGVTWGDAVSNVHITGTDANGNAIYSARGNGNGNGNGTQHHNPELTAAKMRSVLKKHRATTRKNAPPPAAPKPVVTTAVASLVEDVRGLGQRVFGKRTEESAGLLDKGEANDGSAYI